MKARVKVRPGGLINGVEWPEVGEPVDLPAVVVEGMIAAGHLEEVKAKPVAKKAAEKPAAKVEKATAPTAKVETREKK